MSTIDQNIVQQVAKLARLHLSSDETASLQKDLQDILTYADRLNELELQDVAPTAHPFMDAMRLRPDKAQVFANRDKIVENGPRTANQLFQVPRVVDNS